MKDLIETVTTSETPVSVWFDDETHEVGIQYGYVVLSVPVEDFHDLSEAFTEARTKIE